MSVNMKVAVPVGSSVIGSSVVPRTPDGKRTSVRDDGDGVHLGQELGPGEALDECEGDERRVRAITPDAPKRLEPRTQVLALDDQEVPLDDVLEAAAGRRQGRLDVGQDLGGLGAEVARADDLTIGRDRVLAADVDGAERARRRRRPARTRGSSRGRQD